MWETFAGVEFTGDTPNHILGLAYAKACAGKGIVLKPVQRQGAGYHSEEKRGGLCFCDSVYAYTRKIRDFVARFMPNSQLFQSAPQVSWENYDQLLRYQILTRPDLTQIFSGQ